MSDSASSSIVAILPSRRRGAQRRLRRQRPLGPPPPGPRRPIVSTAGEAHELGRYQLPDGTQRTLVAQRINGRVAISDVPADGHEGRVYLVERPLVSKAAMQALAAEYIAESLERGEPAILVPADLARAER